MTYTSIPYKGQLKFLEYESLTEDNRKHPGRGVSLR